MAGSSASLSQIGGGSKAVKLDVVARGKREKGASRENSLNKLAKFRPMQLKNLSSSLLESVDKSKEALKAKNAEQSQLTKRISEAKAQSPFANKSPAEARTGAKINIST